MRVIRESDTKATRMIPAQQTKKIQLIYFAILLGEEHVRVERHIVIQCRDIPNEWNARRVRDRCGHGERSV